MASTKLLQLALIFHLWMPFTEAGTFSIDYDNNRFLLDGQPFRYISGSMHYFRVPSVHWQHRLQVMKAAGLNAVQTYVEWSTHEPENGLYSFQGNADIETFLQTAQEEGLYVILRPGPYICAERDMGGLPYWLITEKPDIKLREVDDVYLKYVDRWLGIFLTKIRPYLYQNGGPVILVQVENEYGSWSSCSYTYTNHLRVLFREYLGQDAALFTTDGAGDGYLKCGKIPSIFATVDFGAGGSINDTFAAQRNFEPWGPLVNSEFYTGWLDHWQEPHDNSNVSEIAVTLDEMLAANASVNMYMFHGGTNFGFTNGANMGATYQPDPTSYDYNAPIAEGGAITPMYTAIRNVISKYVQVPNPVPPTPARYTYGNVSLTKVGNIFEMLPLLLRVPPFQSVYPLSFEEIGQAFGFVLYETLIVGKYPDPSRLDASGLRDRAYVFIDEQPVGVMARSGDFTSLPIVIGDGQKLSLLVENQGRIGYGSELRDIKGFVANVTLNGEILTDWISYSLPFNDTLLLGKAVRTQLASMKSSPKVRRGFQEDARAGDCATGTAKPLQIPTLYTGQFVLDSGLSEPGDSFLRLDGWHKGVAFVNEFNVGRYWPFVGPQITLYVPKSYLKPSPLVNSVYVLELQGSPCDASTVWRKSGMGRDAACCQVQFVDEPEVNGTVPKPLYTAKSVSKLGSSRRPLGRWDVPAKPAPRRFSLESFSEE